MQKIIEFLKSKKTVFEWTIIYFAFLWLILNFVFDFDILSERCWHIFFRKTFYGFYGFVFYVVIYSAIPIYLATTLVINRTNTPLITIPFISKIFPTKKTESEPEPEPEQTSESEPEPEYPPELPTELRIPFMRAKNHLSLHSDTSVYNKPIKQKSEPEQNIAPETFGEFLPTDFDIPESNFDKPENENFIPTFTDINFDEPAPAPEPKKLENNTTKYFSEKNIEYETYKNFVANEKYLIYEHNDNDFWVLDTDSWFASGKQIDSPIKELTELAHQNGLIPVLYLASQNIMDPETTIKQIESSGIRVIKNLDELD